MEGANFENQLKEHLDNHSSSLNLEMEWADLDARRNQKRKKRPFFWLWLGSTVLFFSISFLFLNKESAEEKMTKPAIGVLEDMKQEDVLLKKEALNSTSKKQNELVLSNVTSIPKIVELKPNRIAKKQKTTTLSKNNKPQKTKAIDPLYFQENIETPILQKKVTTNQQSSKSLDAKKLTPTPRLKTKQIFLQIPLALPSLKKEINLKASAVKSLNKRSNWSLGASIAYGKSFRKLDALDALKTPLTDRRNQAEQSLDTWQTALILRNHISKKWFWDLSLGYAQSAVQFKDIKTEFSNPTIEDQLISITYLIDGGTNEQRGEVIADVTTISDNTFYQYQGNGFIQLTGGRNFILNSIQGFSLSTGFKFNAYTFKRGNVFIDESNSYGQLKNTEYRKIGLLHSTTSLEYYHITKNKIRLAIGIQGDLQLNNAFLEKSGLKEKQNILSLSASVMKAF